MAFSAIGIDGLYETNIYKQLHFCNNYFTNFHTTDVILFSQLYQ